MLHLRSKNYQIISLNPIIVEFGCIGIPIVNRVRFDLNEILVKMLFNIQ